VRLGAGDAELADGRTRRKTERPLAAYLWRPAAVATVWELVKGGGTPDSKGSSLPAALEKFALAPIFLSACDQGQARYSSSHAVRIWHAGERPHMPPTALGGRIVCF
jgi:hypothetical protein